MWLCDWCLLTLVKVKETEPGLNQTRAKFKTILDPIQSNLQMVILQFQEDVIQLANSNEKYFTFLSLDTAEETKC